jgi:hypothetical protein
MQRKAFPFRAETPVGIGQKGSTEHNYQVLSLDFGLCGKNKVRFQPPEFNRKARQNIMPGAIINIRAIF